MSPINLDCFICDKGKVSKIPSCFLYVIFFVSNLASTLRRSLNFKKLFMSFFMTFNELIIKQFPVQTSNPFIKGLFIISTFFDAVIIVDVNPAFILDYIALVWSFLSVVPLGRYMFSSE